MAQVGRIAVLPGGGDCPGINAVIRAVVLDAAAHGIEVVGVMDGFSGLIEDRMRVLSPQEVRPIVNRGGSILGCSNKANPSRVPMGKDATGAVRFEDRRGVCIEHMRRRGIEALVVIGGDGTMTCARGLIDIDPNVRCVGIPKTIDNDIVGTDQTFGFMTAVQTATEAIDRVQTTAASHHRAIVVEVMGRNAGWLALHAGIASGSEVILLPELPFEPRIVAEQVKRACERGGGHAVVCVSEGAAPRGGEQVAVIDESLPDPVRLGGIGAIVSGQIQEMTGIDSRNVVLGHIQRGGSPVASDRILATQFGQRAMDLVRQGKWRRMVARKNGVITDVPMAEAAGRQRLIPPDDPLVASARAVGVGFGDA